NSKSNGHGRAQAGSNTVTRQSNMIIKSDKKYSDLQLRKKLIKACKKLNKPYGYLFEEVSGGFTSISRFMPNAFNVNPLEVYRVYTDGRPDELVRGVSLIGTPLAMFAEIELAGDKTDVFNGFCGAESGSVPVSTVSPAVFVQQIETQKKIHIESAKTILERPGINNPSNPKQK
ncbi:MAG: metallopeptidase TldD-related protein, partial [Draconibacterium sp.]|nr:metallopeptidase TldD-related protein [Draconibacterium sp.]